MFEHSQGLNQSSASTQTVRAAKSETVWVAKGADGWAARQRIGGQRKIRSAKHREQQITVDHALHAGMKTLAVGSKLTKVGATPTLVSVAALQQTSDDKAPNSSAWLRQIPNGQ